MENRIWKDVVGYEGLYKVSNTGEVKSLPRIKRTPTTTYLTKERLLTPIHSKGGYFRVILTKNGKGRQVFLHRIVAEAFIGVRKNMTVNHKDENKSNNNADNLEYLTRAENVRYGTGVERSARARKENPYNAIPVNQYMINGSFVARYTSARQAIEKNGWNGCGSDVLDCCRRKGNTARGFVWRFDGDTDTSFTKGTNARGVIQLTLDGVFVARYKSIEDAALTTKCQKGHICSCCRGEREKTGGYRWVYAEDYK